MKRKSGLLIGGSGVDMISTIVSMMGLFPSCRGGEELYFPCGVECFSSCRRWEELYFPVGVFGGVDILEGASFLVPNFGER